jgi:hypothetical protein
MSRLDPPTPGGDRFMASLPNHDAVRAIAAYDAFMVRQAHQKGLRTVKRACGCHDDAAG